MREERFGNRFACEIPDHGPQFIILVETQSVVNCPEFASIIEENMTAFAVGIIAEQVKEDNRFKEGFFIISEIEVVVIGIEFDVLLKRTCAERTIGAEAGKWNKAKSQRFTDEIRGDLAQGEGIVFEIPEGLLATRGLIDGGESLALVMHIHKEGVVRAKQELAFEFDLSLRKYLLEKIVGHGVILLYRHGLRVLNDEIRKFQGLTF